jgi:uncharacterized protein YkwD
MLLIEINRLRENPKGYVKVLEQYKKLFKGNKVYRPGETTLLTKEGVAPVDEAIEYLKHAPQLPPLYWSKGLSRAALDHVLDLGHLGDIGHSGSDGSSLMDRVRRYGELRGLVGENLGFGYQDAKRMLLLLVVDDGVPDRGHRNKFFNRRYKVAGAACGLHKVYSHMCVVDFAEGYTEKTGGK